MNENCCVYHDSKHTRTLMFFKPKKNEIRNKNDNIEKRISVSLIMTVCVNEITRKGN